MKRSPNWRPEELMLALELYLSKDLKWLSRISDHTPEIVALSNTLQNLDFFPDPKPEKFRSVGSIRMKLANFKSLDSKYGKSSLSNIGQLDRAIWEKYCLSYDDLFLECSKVISEHLKGNPSKEAIDYCDRLLMKKDTDNEFKAILEEVGSLIPRFRNLCIQRGEKKIASACTNIMDMISAIKESPKEYVEHGGINQERIDKDLKIGKLVRTEMRRLIEEGKITPEIYEQLKSESECKRIFNIGHPLVKEIDTDISLEEQKKDKNGHLRYWKDTYELYGNTIVLCKEWYESNRVLFLNWLSEVDSDSKTSKAIITDILKFIQITDLKEVSVSTKDIKTHFPEYDDLDELIERLLDIGVLAPYQRSLREFIIDDYDLFYKALKNPELV